ncbi:hypothetical protein HY17_19130 [Hyphomonas sp. CY54-11-8]|nr:hypothetical protein HY17_19130 [Hyphomonas sp. CY54-11-8]
MIAFQEDQICADVWRLPEKLDYTAGIRAAIDQVSEHDDGCLASWA